MKSLKPSQIRFNRGFGLMEVVVVIGLMALIALGGYMISIGGFQRYAFASERDLVINLLHKARSRAINNVGQSEHTVELDSAAGEFILREETSGSEVKFPKDPSVTITPSNFTVTFEQLSGDAEDLDITIEKGAQNIVIDIDSNGRINW